MTARILIVLGLVAACRREPSDRATSPPHAPAPDPAPTVATAPDGSGGSGAPAPAPAGPPPGTDALIRVPDTIVAKVKLEEVVKGLRRPVALVAAPDDARKRLFIVEQHVGRIRILEQGKLAAKPFLDLGKLVSTAEEQGLLGLAFHPKYAQNGKLYVYYTTDDEHLHIVEYRVSTTDPDAVDPATRKELIDIPHPYTNHNGGHLLFGPDGKLYAGTGDGGSAGDPKRNGQNPTTLLAKILRFDVDAADPKPEIVHMGVRNPWRFSFDVKTNGLYIGDVGQNLWEYVWVVPIDSPRRNFGWNVVEGSHCYKAKTCDKTGFTPPAAEYPHDAGCSITGGIVYRGKALPFLDGRYFYADYCTGLLRSFTWTEDKSSPTSPGFVRDHWDWKASLDRAGLLSQISSFGVDHDGELYLLKLSGVIYRLAPR